MKRLLTLAMVLFAFYLSSHAQMESIWEAKSGSKIYWNEFAPCGHLIVGTKDDATIAFDQKTGEQIWKKSFNYGKFDILPNTPFIYYDTEEAGLIVIDPSDGKILCNSTSLGMEHIEAFYPVRAGNNFLVYTQMDDREQFWMISLSTGKLLWKQDLDLDKDTEIAGGFITIEEDPEAKGLMCNPVGDNKGGVFVAVHDRIIYFNKQGEINWDIEYPSMFGDQEGFFKAATVQYSNIFPDMKGENIYVFSGGYMTCHKAIDGSLSWEKPVKVTGPVKNLIFDKKGMILLPASDNNAMKKHKFNLIDYKTGEKLWGEEGTEFKGGYIQSQYCSKGIVLITKAYMNESYFFNIININDGSMLLNKSEKIFPGPYSFEEVNGGILISSAKGANIFNYDSQEFIINKELKTGGEDFLLKADKESKVYFYTSAKNTIIEFDKTSLQAKEFNKDKIKFESKDLAKGLDIFEDGIVLFSDQNLIKYDWEGNTIYQKYYKAPGQGWLNVTGNVLGATFKVLGGLAQVATSMATVAMVENMDQAAREGMHDLDKTYEEYYGVDQDLVDYRKDVAEYEQNMDQAKQQMNADMQEMAAMGVLNAMDIGDNINAIKGRFKNSKATKNYLVLMTKDKERGTGLAIVSKIDGEIKGFIPMSFSKENPSYTIDPFTNILFWMPNLDNGTNTFGKYNNIKDLENSGAIISYDLNQL
jgi:outer membrane protein assembly factor BamB